MKLLTATAFLLSFTVACFAQRSFTINKASKKYNATISVNACEDGICQGSGMITLTDKNAKPVQVLKSEDLFFFLDSTQNPTANTIELYNEQSPLIFDDFNFDGQEDLAIRNGNNSGYGGPSYDVYVFNSTKNKFVLSDELTTLATENLGMFETNHKTKRLTAYAKSGCCLHITTEYSIVPKKGLVKVGETTEDATGKKVIVTTRKLVNNKWVKTVKTMKKED
jgi:hypothetical protein